MISEQQCNQKTNYFVGVCPVTDEWSLCTIGMEIFTIDYVGKALKSSWPDCQ